MDFDDTMGAFEPPSKVKKKLKTCKKTSVSKGSSYLIDDLDFSLKNNNSVHLNQEELTDCKRTIKLKKFSPGRKMTSSLKENVRHSLNSHKQETKLVGNTTTNNKASNKAYITSNNSASSSDENFCHLNGERETLLKLTNSDLNKEQSLPLPSFVASRESNIPHSNEGTSLSITSIKI